MPLPEPPIVVEFRDGEHSIPPHVMANISIAEIDPQRYTYEEAVQLSNNAILRSYVNKFGQDVIYKHFRDNR
jgi:hypothetical protein